LFGFRLFHCHGNKYSKDFELLLEISSNYFSKKLLTSYFIQGFKEEIDLDKNIKKPSENISLFSV